MYQIANLRQLKDLIQFLPEHDEETEALARMRQGELTKPPGSLGRLEELAIWLCAWQSRERPQLKKIQALVFAGNHGVTAQGVSAYPAEVTGQMVENFKRGGAAINQLCEVADARLEVVALELDTPTQDFTRAPALDESAFIKCFNAGLSAVESKADCLIVGEMGIGNTTVAAAVCFGLFGGAPADWVGRGTGVDDAGLKLKENVLQQGHDCHKSVLKDPLEVLRCLGGRELVAIAGAVLAARQARIPVLLDGFISTAAVAPLEVMVPGVLDHCVVGHCSSEPGHHRLLKHLKKEPLLDLNMRLGEGSGAAIAALILKAAVGVHNGMATFAEAGVSEKT